MFCPQCGTAHTPGGRFCGNCGLLLPFAVLAGVGPDAGARSPDTPAFAAAGSAPQHLAASSSSFTVAVVACVVAFGVFFLAASAVVRIVIGDEPTVSARAGAAAPTTSQGMLGALLSSRRAQPADPGKLK